MNTLKEHIEKYASVIEALGYSPVAARLYLYIMHKGDTGTSFQELVEYFKYSKSAVSKGLKILLKYLAIIENKSTNSRRRIFVFNFEKTVNEDAIIYQLTKLQEMYESVATWRNCNDTYNEQLKHIALLHKLILIEFPIILNRWKSLRD